MKRLDRIESFLSFDESKQCNHITRKQNKNPQRVLYECFSDVFFNNFPISFIIFLDSLLTGSTLTTVYSSGLASLLVLTEAWPSLVHRTSRACDVPYFPAQLLPVAALSLCLTSLSISRWLGSFLVGFPALTPGLTQLPLCILTTPSHITRVSNVLAWGLVWTPHYVLRSTLRQGFAFITSEPSVPRLLSAHPGPRNSC